MCKQIVYYFFGNPVISIPEGSLAKRLKFLSYYPAFTLKRRIVKLYLLLCILFGIDKISDYVRSRAKEYSGEKVDDFSEVVRKYFTYRGYAEIVLFWGTHSTRKRVYIYLYDKAGHHVAFGKISFTVEEFYLIENEIFALKKYSASSLTSVSIPSFYDSGELLGGRYIITEALPQQAELVRQNKDVFPASIVNEYSGASVPVSVGDVWNSWWWLKYSDKKSEFTNFDYSIQSLTNKNILLASIHGDLGSTNIFIYGGKYWIVDWEQFCDRGPYLTDEVSYWLGANYKDLIIEKDIVYINFRCFIEERKFEKQDAMFALVFLIAADFNLAEIIAKNWEKVRF